MKTTTWLGPLLATMMVVSASAHAAGNVFDNLMRFVDNRDQGQGQPRQPGPPDRDYRRYQRDDRGDRGDRGDNHPRYFTPEERRQLRQDINNAGRDLYRPERRRH